MTPELGAEVFPVQSKRSTDGIHSGSEIIAFSATEIITLIGSTITNSLTLTSICDIYTQKSFRIASERSAHVCPC